MIILYITHYFLLILEIGFDIKEYFMNPGSEDV